MESEGGPGVPAGRVKSLFKKLRSRTNIGIGLRHARKRYYAAALDTAFDKFAPANQGSMSSHELGQMFSAVSFNMSQFQLKNVHAEIINGNIINSTVNSRDGQDGGTESHKGHRKGQDGHGSETKHYLTRDHFTRSCLRYLDDALTEESVQATFKVLDPDRDGNLSVVEIHTLMHGFGSAVTIAEVDTMMTLAKKYGYTQEQWRVFEKEFYACVSELPYITKDLNPRQKLAQGRWMEFRMCIVLVHVLTEWYDYTQVAYGEEWQEQWGLEQRKRCCFFHPNSPWRTMWDVAMLPIFVQILIFVPYRLAFGIDVEPRDWDFWVDVGVDVYFLADLIINFRTAYYVGNGKLVTDSCKIAKEYLRSWFIIDFFSCLPITYVAMLVQHLQSNGQPQSQGNGGARLKMMKILRLMRLVKNLAKISKLKKLKEIKIKYEDQLGPLMTVVELFKFLIMLFFCGHMMACMWYVVGSIDEQTGDGEPIYGWVHRMEWNETDSAAWFGTRYTAALFTALTDTVGDWALTDTEKLYGLVQHFIYEGFFGFLIGTMTSMIMASRVSEQLKSEKRTALKEYLRIQHVPIKTRKRISLYYDHMFKHKTVFEEQIMLDDLPESIRAEIVNRVVNNFLETCKVVFWGFQRDIVLPLAIAMKRMPCVEEDIIVREGDEARELYFMILGTADEFALYDSPHEKQLGTINEGSFFGEAELLLRYDDELRDDPEKHLCTRRRTVIANTEGDLGFLCYDALIDVMRRQPTLVFRLRALASKRRDKEQRHQLDAGPTDAEITISEQMSLTKTPIHSGPFSAVTAGVAMMKKATSPLPRIRLEEVKNDQSSTKQADDDVVVPPSGDSSELLRSGDSTESMRSVETPSKSKSRMAMLVDDSGSGSAPRSPRRRNGRKSGRGEPGVNLKLGSWVHIKVGFGGMEKIWCALDRSSKMRSEGQLCLKFSIGLHEAPFALCPEIVLNTSSAVRESTVPDAPDSEVEVMSDRGRTRILRIGGDVEAWINAVNAAVRNPSRYL